LSTPVLGDNKVRKSFDAVKGDEGRDPPTEKEEEKVNL
jgi:hypothetical protein